MGSNMTVAEYRAENSARMVKLEERQISIFKAIQRVEKHLDKLNGQVEENKTNLTKISTVGTIGIIVTPVVVSIIMRLV
tara:strand:+ start:121 stop:357 length:237 start_codon:yes stop_codon:yes gene_type:complete